MSVALTSLSIVNSTPSIVNTNAKKDKTGFLKKLIKIMRFVQTKETCSFFPHFKIADTELTL